MTDKPQGPRTFAEARRMLDASPAVEQHEEESSAPDLNDALAGYRKAWSAKMSGPLDLSDYGALLFEQLQVGAVRTDTPFDLGIFTILMQLELNHARTKHVKPLNSHHEAYAVVLEELTEAWHAVMEQRADPQAVLAEIIQVAAMCMRWAEDVCWPQIAEHERERAEQKGEVQDA